MERLLKEQNGNCWKRTLKIRDEFLDYEHQKLKWNGTRTELLEKKEREWNNHPEGPCSRTERKEFKKV